MLPRLHDHYLYHCYRAIAADNAIDASITGYRITQAHSIYLPSVGHMLADLLGPCACTGNLSIFETVDYVFVSLSAKY
jgi:hypothetical protein